MSLQIQSEPSMRDLANTFMEQFKERKFKGELAKNGFDPVSDHVEFTLAPSIPKLIGDKAYQIDAHAPDFPLAVDKLYLGQKLGATKAVMDAIKKDPKSARMRYVWNRKTGKLDVIMDAKVGPKLVGDSTGYVRDGFVKDAPINLVNAQLFAPANMGWLTKPFYQVLAYSKALLAVSVEPGNNPFASALNLPLISFGGGFATLNGAGAFNNVDTFDVDAQADALSNTVLNFEATYRLTVEEKARQEYGDVAPFGGQVLSAKIKYASWVMDMFRDVLIWYGNTATGTNGIINSVPVTAWASSGFGAALSLNNITRNNTTNPGAVAYLQFAQAVVAFLTASQNKPTEIKIFVSPLAYNLLGSMPYSTTLNPASALQTLVDNFIAGPGPTDNTPKIEIIPEPLISATVNGVVNIWNANTFDYMVILAPTIPGGIPDEPQKTIICGIPLQKYMYPAMPGTYQIQYKMLTRYAGLYVPYTPIIAVYSGFGILTSTT